MIGANSALYLGEVVHQRLKPRRHRLAYRVFSLLVDLDELPVLDRQLRFFSYNRFNLFSFLDRDHGPGEAAPLRPWVERHLAAAKITLDGGAIRMLCYPRLLGYVFNPLTVYFCHHRNGDLAAILYEVNNTFGGRHTYVIPAARDRAGRVSQECGKVFYVSPFNAVAGRYRFRIDPPEQHVSVVINHSDTEGPLLYAAFKARRAALSDRALLATFFRYPLMTLKVIAGIHWEALRLWRKGLRLVDRPEPPCEAVTIVTSPEPHSSGA
jgi:uncharacterized protein